MRRHRMLILGYVLRGSSSLYPGPWFDPPGTAARPAVLYSTCQSDYWPKMVSTEEILDGNVKQDN